MKKIAFFGSSITQQKTGYVHWFKVLNPNVQVYQHGYGSMYITDAGICFIDDVISNAPEYCFIDWFSSGCYRPPERLQEYLDTILEKLFGINCYPIFLIFYRKNMDKGWFDMFDYLRRIAEEYRINMVDLSKLDNPDSYLRDNIHTNDLGSEVYGKLISERFQKMEFERPPKIISKNKYSNMKRLHINQTFRDSFKIRSLGSSSIIGILQNIGPYTDDVECSHNGTRYTIKVKDQWSERYEREAMKISTPTFSGELSLNIRMDTKLVLKTMFYIGDTITLFPGENGCWK